MACGDSIPTRTTPPPGGSGEPLLWGAGSTTETTTTRFLFPGYDDSLALVAPRQWRAPIAGVLRNMRVRVATPAGNGNAIVYTLRVNGVATALLVSMASTAADGSDLVNSVAIAAGDLLDIQVTKAVDVATPPTGMVASLEWA